MKAGFNPSQYSPTGSPGEIRDYYAGYSDGFHGAHLGAGLPPSMGRPSAEYNVGYIYGCRDFAAARYANQSDYRKTFNPTQPERKREDEPVKGRI